MYKQERKTVTEIKLVTVAVVCDVCKKEHIGNDYPDGWHMFSTSHSEWGNDSIDSYEKFLVCSAKCYADKLKELVENADGYPSTRIDEMDLIFATDLSNMLNQ